MGDKIRYMVPTLKGLKWWEFQEKSAVKKALNWTKEPDASALEKGFNEENFTDKEKEETIREVIYKTYKYSLDKWDRGRQHFMDLLYVSMFVITTLIAIKSKIQ